jgi:subtilase family serine protease
MQATRMWVVAAIAATIVGSASAAPALIKAKPEVIDLGAAANVVGQGRISLTIALKLRNTDELEPLLQATYTAGGPGYRKFLTPEEFGVQLHAFEVGRTSESAAVRAHANLA